MFRNLLIAATVLCAVAGGLGALHYNQMLEAKTAEMHEASFAYARNLNALSIDVAQARADLEARTQEYSATYSSMTADTKAAAADVNKRARSLVRAGYMKSLMRHGDWLVMRTAAGHCTAFSPDKGEDQGDWLPRLDGRCHLSDFLKPDQ